MTTTEFLIAIIVAILGSNGLWMFLSKVLDKKSKGYKDIEELKNTIGEIKQEVDKLADIGIKNNNLAKATARERLNRLNHKYRQQGYIPSSDLVAYKLIGEAYEEADGNTVVFEEFKLCMEELPRK